ncbi:unnamed protein product [Clavelina lepadiformis]|uniref:Uncharacterized protein n=1 Tax=Clavelina lepadiformis TaxID=159417 RepID=A0ABP0H1A5_CLALP
MQNPTTENDQQEVEVAVSSLQYHNREVDHFSLEAKYIQTFSLLFQAYSWCRLTLSLQQVRNVASTLNVFRLKVN